MQKSKKFSEMPVNADANVPRNAFRCSLEKSRTFLHGMVRSLSDIFGSTCSPGRALSLFSRPPLMWAKTNTHEVSLHRINRMHTYTWYMQTHIHSHVVPINSQVHKLKVMFVYLNIGPDMRASVIHTGAIFRMNSREMRREGEEDSVRNRFVESV